MWLISLRDLQWRRRRFLIAILATGLVFAMTLLMSGASAGLSNESRSIVAQFRADVWFVRKGASGPFTTLNALPASSADEVRHIPGVTGADPVAVFHSTINRSGLRDVNIIGYRLGGIGAPVVSTGVTPAGSGKAVADTRLKLRLGDRVALGGRDFEVVGLADNVTWYFGTPTLFIPLGDAQRIVFGGQPLAMAVVARGKPSSVPNDLAVVSNQAARKDLERPAKSGQQSIQFITVLLWLVAAGIIASIVYLSALERVRDFAVLKATGTSSRALLGGLAIQGVVLSAASAVVAAVVAQLLGPHFPLPVQIQSRAYVELVAIAVAVGLLASLGALRRAVAVDPAAAFGG